MNHNTTQQTDMILSEARKLNSDLGRHVKNCSFSSNLSGRFYQNNSMESHKARAHRIAQMKAKRRQLERSLEIEEMKISYLEKTLQERKQKRLEEQELRIRTVRAAIVIQSQIRGFLCRNTFEVMRVENDIVNYIVHFIQALYRGRRERKRVNQIKMKIIQHRKEQLAAIQIQSHVRRFNAKIELDYRIKERMIQQNEAACLIQAHIRGCNDRQFVKTLIQDRSATKIQSQYRGMIGRQIRDSLIKVKKKKKEKPHRMPLHERRYSTYSIETSRRDSLERRRFTDIVSLVKPFNGEQGLSALEILRLAHTKKEQKEKNEINCNAKSIPKRGSVNSKAQKFEEKCLGVTDSNESNDKIIRSRQKAAARAARLKRKSMVEKERQLQQVKDRKKDLDQLELNRRNMMKQETMARKEKEFSKTKQEKNANCKQHQHTKELKISNFSCGDDDDTRLEREYLENKEFENGKHNIINGVNFDENFEEDIRENEFDLDDMG